MGAAAERIGERPRGVGIGVEQRDAVPGLCQVHGHRRAHHTQADESDLH